MTVRLEQEGAVMVVVVDRPQARNALDPKAMQALGKAAELLAKSPDVRAVVLAGGGGRFIAGGDLKILAKLRTAAEGAEMGRTMQRVLDAFEALTVPVIAAIDRFALGGGAEVALACDLRVASTDAIISFKHGDFALTSSWGGARRLARLVGRSRALRWFWLSTTLSAQEALDAGLIDQIALPGQTAREAAVALAQTLVARDPLMVAGIKRLLVHEAELGKVEHRALEAELFGETWGGEAHWTAVDAFGQRKRHRKAPKRGRFIVLEGLDGAGTTTQASRLADWLTQGGRTVHQTAEPSTGPLGVLLRQALSKRVSGREGTELDPRAVALLFAGDRADHLRTEIEPALARGEDVICDRYVLSSLAYQGVDSPPEWIARLNGPMLSPDVTLFITVPAEIAGARRAERGSEPEIYETDAFQQQVAAGYQSAGKWRPNDRVITIDGSGDIDTVHRLCREAIKSLD